jgi:hypothetical protein
MSRVRLPQFITHPRPAYWLVAILVLQFTLGTLRIISTPLWEDHESDFYTVIRHLTMTGALPVEADYPPGEADARQVTQPPLYFYAAAPILALFDAPQNPVPSGEQPPALCIGVEAFNTTLVRYPAMPQYQFPPRNEALGGTMLRFLSLFFGMVTTVLIYLSARMLTPNAPYLALLPAALLAFEPTALKIATTISNDSLLLMLSALNLLFALKLLLSQPTRWRYAFGLIICAGLAVQTRLPGWSLVAFNGLLIAFVIGRSVWSAVRKRAFRRQLWIPLLVAGGLLVAFAIIALINLSRSGSVIGRYDEINTLLPQVLQQFSLSPEMIGGMFDMTAQSSVEALQNIGIPRPLQIGQTVTIVTAILIALILMIVALIRRKRGKPSSIGVGLLALFGIALTTVLLVYVRNLITASALGGVTSYNTAGIFAPLRYYTPALPALALIICIGLMAISLWVVGLISVLIGRRHENAVYAPNPLGYLITFALIAWLATVGVAGIVKEIRQHPDPYAFLNLSMNYPQLEAQTGFPQVVAYTIQAGEQPGLLALDLYVTADAPLEYNAAVQIGLGANTCTFIPAQGYDGTLLWQPDEIHRVSAIIPNCTGDLTAPADLTLTWQNADLDGNIVAESSPVTLTTIDPPLATYAGCPTILGTLAGSYTVVKLNSPASVTIGENYQPSLNWIVRSVNLDAAAREFVFTHSETGTEYTCDRMDRGVQQWQTGEYVYFDRCPFSFPPDAPTGSYTIGVRMISGVGEVMPAVDPQGNVLADGILVVGAVNVTP